MFNRYKHTRLKTDNKTGIKYQKPTLYPEIPERDTDIIYHTRVGDRLDLLSHQFYSDSGMWWIISRANSLDPSAVAIAPGTELRIPTEIGEVVSSLKTLNYGN
jgi:hypothetical protein